jgi:hypothetical protein
MLYLTYDALNGAPYRDGEIEHYITAIVHAQNEHPLTLMELSTATDNIINGIRVAIKQGRIPLHLVRLQFRNYYPHGMFFGGGLLQTLAIDGDGRISDWPVGFCDTNDKFIEALIDWTDDAPAGDIGSPDSV